jgi:hypothetical protein
MGRGLGNQAALYSDDRDGLELKPLHRVHGSGPHRLRVVAFAQRDRRDAVGLQHLACLANEAGGPGRHADGLRFDAECEPRPDLIGEKAELF